MGFAGAFDWCTQFSQNSLVSRATIVPYQPLRTPLRPVRRGEMMKARIVHAIGISNIRLPIRLGTSWDNNTSSIDGCDGTMRAPPCASSRAYHHRLLRAPMSVTDWPLWTDPIDIDSYLVVDYPSELITHYLARLEGISRCVGDNHLLLLYVARMTSPHLHNHRRRKPDSNLPRRHYRKSSGHLQHWHRYTFSGNARFEEDFCRTCVPIRWPSYNRANQPLLRPRICSHRNWANRWQQMASRASLSMPVQIAAIKIMIIA